MAKNIKDRNITSEGNDFPLLLEPSISRAGLCASMARAQRASTACSIDSQAAPGMKDDQAKERTKLILHTKSDLMKNFAA